MGGGIHLIWLGWGVHMGAGDGAPPPPPGGSGTDIIWVNGTSSNASGNSGVIQV